MTRRQAIAVQAHVAGRAKCKISIGQVAKRDENMRAKRGLTSGRVMFWLCGPTFVAAALVAWGIHLGSLHRDPVRRLEWRFFDVGASPVGYHPAADPSTSGTATPGTSEVVTAVAPPPALPPASPVFPVVPATAAGALPGPLEAVSPWAPAAAEPPSLPVGSQSVDSSGGVRPPLVGVPSWVPAPPPTSLSPAIAVGQDPGAPLAPSAQPTPGIDRLAVPIGVRVKLLVDDRWAVQHPDWVQRSQRALLSAAETYRSQFGIQLSLVGVVLWGGPRQNQTLVSLYRDLRGHPREGADVVLGLLGQPLPHEGYMLGAPAAGVAFNGAYGLVGLHDAGRAQPDHARAMMRTLGHLFGAVDVRDPASQAYTLGTWMSAAPAPSARPPWIDLENRQRILLRKGLPFMPEAP